MSHRSSLRWSRHNAAAVIVLALLLLASGLLLYLSRHIIFAALIGMVLANAIYRISIAVGPRLHIKPFFISMAQIILLAALTGGAIYVGYDAAAAQFDELVSSLKQVNKDLRVYLQETQWGSALLQQEQDGQAARRAMQWSAGILSSLFKTLGPLAVLLVVLIYGCLEPRPYRRGLLWLLPDRWEKQAITMLGLVSDALLWWLAGRIASMSIVGILTWLGLWILGVPGPLALALIAGLFSFVPNLGPVLSVIPASAVAFSVSRIDAFYVLILYIAIQAVESNLITPLIQRQAVTVPPALLIVFQLAMGVIAGVWGMVVATPLLVIILLLLQKLYIRDTLHRNGPLLTEASN